MAQGVGADGADPLLEEPELPEEPHDLLTAQALRWDAPEPAPSLEDLLHGSSGLGWGCAQLVENLSDDAGEQLAG